MAAKKHAESSGPSLALKAMVIMAILGALVAGLSFEIIKYWPLPQSVEPYFGFTEGMWWGLLAGAGFGWVIGFITDENKYEAPE